MSRWLPAVAIGCLLALVALFALRPGEPASDAQRADALAHELRCPDCAGLSVADSPTTSAREMRRQIDELVAGGATDDEVRLHFVDRYGQWIRLAPSSPAAWLIPFAVLIAGVGALTAWLLRRPSPPVATMSISAGERQSLREEADALDA
ncbi:MAG TPA: cytochrome c-type biogenesis protein CcmH [Candidatus Limnocylindria bacterium]|nr:cytochrome c-type biogenesis protein CcmH [Candidatus Limnocylindria bacterium]